MITIHKYLLENAKILDSQEGGFSNHNHCYEMELPARHTLLDVQRQDGKLAFWAEVDTESSMEKFRFFLVLTGGRFPSLPEGHFLDYMRTVQDGDFLYHIYQWKFKLKVPV